MAGKRKIINDPVYGFITIRHRLILDIVDHAWFQRLRRIAQLGLSHLVYPGATHNRFQHAVGAMNLMQGAVDEIRHKGHAISEDEEIGLLAAVLLHDIGHGPFSHALERTLVPGLHHEEISAIMMAKLNEEMSGSLSLAIGIFNNEHEKKFLHQLVSSQLDMDRLDYLARDSFFSGVVEGQVGSERILKMLDVVDDQLVVEEKGIYSIEKFIVARRFMYWQVYLHHAVLSAEFMLVNVLKRARELAAGGYELFCTPALRYFLYRVVGKDEFSNNAQALIQYANLDDHDIMAAMKVWQSGSDKVLAALSRMLLNRKLFKIEIQHEPFSPGLLALRIDQVAAGLGISKAEAAYFVIHEKVDNRAYNQLSDSIRIKMKNGKVRNASAVSDHLNLEVLNQKVEKWFVAWPELVRG